MVPNFDESDMAALHEERQSQRKFINMQTSIIFVGLLGNVIIMLFVFGRLQVSPSDVKGEVQKVQREIGQLHQLAQHRSYREVMTAAINDSTLPDVLVDNNGIVVAWSDGAAELFGLQRKNAVGYGIAFLMGPDNRSQHRNAFEAAMARGGKRVRTNRIECDAKTTDGDTLPLFIDLWYMPGVAAIARFSKRE